MFLIQIVPRLPPATDGLGDYALNIARQLRKDFDIKTQFIITDQEWMGNCEIEGFPIRHLTNRSATSLSSCLTSFEHLSVVLLHYVGYGYAKRGAPTWLINGLEAWLASSRTTRLLTMFHEIYASGPIWSSSFWLSPLQKHLASRLARLSDACFTSRQNYAQILSTLRRSKHDSINTLPVFSTIGEPKQPPRALRDRRSQLIVFGSAGSRARVYENSLSALKKVCRDLAIEKVYDVGPPTRSVVSHVNGIRVVQMGRRPAEEISALLSESIAGFFDYHTGYLAKSTIFAAYSAHGLIPVSASPNAVQVDGLLAGKHYWMANSCKLPDGQAIADNACAWYQTHKLSEHGKVFEDAIRHS